MRSIGDRLCHPAFYHVPMYLKKKLIRLEKRAIAIMNPGTHYDMASEVLNMRLIEEHHNLLCVTPSCQIQVSQE